MLTLQPKSTALSLGLRTAPDIAAIDLFVVLTIGFKLLHGLVIIHLERRCLICTRQPDRGMDRPANDRSLPLGSGGLVPGDWITRGYPPPRRTPSRICPDGLNGTHRNRRTST